MSNSNYQRYRWTSIWLCLGTVFGILFVIWFSLQDKLNTGVLLLWAMAYLVIGGLLGFIFSVPKIITDAPPSPNPPPGPIGGGQGQQGNGGPNPPNPAIQNAVPMTVIGKTRAQENTNLTQISDWLTKILIGAGLVQLKEVPGFVHHIAVVMGSGLAEKSNINESNAVTMMCAAIILYFITWGFICGYLVMKLVLTDQFINAGGDDDDNTNSNHN